MEIIDNNKIFFVLLFGLVGLGLAAGEKRIQNQMANKNSVIEQREGIGNTLYRITVEKKATLAFIGGSITEMKSGYVSLVEKLLRRKYPECDFSIINAGISSTCSDTGAFRLRRDVLSKAKRIDLLMVEFAVNDNQDGHFTRQHAICCMEGIVRQARKSNPAINIVFLYTANKSHIRNYTAGKIPLEIAAHETVAEHYKIPFVNLARLVATGLKKHFFDWKTFGGVHPASFGNELYAKTILKLFEQQHIPKKISLYSLTEKKCDKFAFEFGRLINVDEAQCGKYWSVMLPEWKTIPGAKRRHFDKKPVLFSNTPGAEFTLKFSGHAIGLLLTAGPDAGRIRYRIDNSVWQEAELFTRYSTFLHYPYTLILSSELARGQHILRVRVDNSKHEKSRGHTMRIAAFTIN